MKSKSGKSGGAAVTKRELFAAMAMQAIISKNPAVIIENESREENDQAVAQGAVFYADALLKELSK